MNATQKSVALILREAKPEKNSYATAVMGSQTCPCSAKVDASTWAEWAATDSWFVTAAAFAWKFFHDSAKNTTNTADHEEFLRLAGYYSD